MKRILIVEDDVDIHEILATILKNANYSILDAYSGTEALLLLAQKEVDLVILDMMLPGVSGENIIKSCQNIPIIVLSAMSNVEDKVKALEMGASDYMTKPFDKDELIARVAVQMRTKSKNNRLEYKELALKKDEHTLLIGSKEIPLTKTEYAIMKQLLLNPEVIITKTSLLELIASDTEDGSSESLKVHISNLRKKMRSVSATSYIESVWGIGFKLKF